MSPRTEPQLCPWSSKRLFVSCFRKFLRPFKSVLPYYPHEMGKRPKELSLQRKTGVAERPISCQEPKRVLRWASCPVRWRGAVGSLADATFEGLFGGRIIDRQAETQTRSRCAGYITSYVWIRLITDPQQRHRLHTAFFWDHICAQLRHTCHRSAELDGPSRWSVSQLRA